MTLRTAIENVVKARAAEIVEFVNMGMPLEWTIEYLRNSTSLSESNIERAIEIAKKELEAK